MGYEITPVNNLDILAEPSWTAILDERPFHSLAWHRLHPASWYTLIQNDGKPSGLASFYLTSSPGIQISSHFIRRLLKIILTRRPLLVCWSPVGSSDGCLFEPNADVLKSLQPTLMKIAKQSKASFIVFGSCSDTLADSLAGSLKGFSRMGLGDGLDLPVRWPSFDDYVASLSHRGRRKYRNHSNRAAELGIRLVTTDDWRKELPRLKVLLQNVAEKYDDPLDEEVWVLNWGVTVPDGMSSMVLAYCGDILAGYMLRLRDGDHLRLVSLGLDYQYSHIYFQLFYEAIRYAIENGIKVIHGGSGAYEFKEILGFERVHANVVLRPTSGILGRLMQLVARPDASD